MREDGAGVSTVTIPVGGMTCAACSGRVQRALEKQPGVREAAVNLMTKNATVGYDPLQITPEGLVGVIRDTGYEAELAPEGRTAFEEQAAQDEAQSQEYRELRNKAVLSFVAAAVAMLLSMPLMEPVAGAHAEGADPFMMWAMMNVLTW